MKRSVITLAILGICSTATAKDVRIGYVDLQRVLAETKQGKSAKSKLQKVFKKKQAEIDKKIGELKQAQAQFQKDRVMLKPDAANKKAATLDEQMRQLQMLYVKHQEELSKQEAKAMQQIFGKTETILQSIAKREGISMILEKTQSSILWAQPSLDLTNELVRRYNSGK